MTSVATFGDAMAAVAQQTTDVMSKMPRNCRDLRALVAEQRMIAISALAQNPPRPVPGTFTPPYRDSDREQLSQYVTVLGSVDDKIKQNCDKMASFAPQLQALSTSLAAYAAAIKALAQDEFVTYRPEFDTLPKSIGAIPTGGSKALLTNSQLSAINGLDVLVYKAATESYRQSELKEVLNNEEPVVQVVRELEDVADRYTQEVLLLGLQEQAAADNGIALQRQRLLFEPIASQEYAARMAIQRQVAQAQSDALNAYIDVLKKVRPTLEKARDSVNHIPMKDLAAEVKEFAQSAYSVQKKLRDAF